MSAKDFFHNAVRLALEDVLKVPHMDTRHPVLTKFNLILISYFNNGISIP